MPNDVLPETLQYPQDQSNHTTAPDTGYTHSFSAASSKTSLERSGEGNRVPKIGEVVLPP